MRNIDRPWPKEVLYLALNEVKPSKNNARTHSKKQIRQIANSIEAHGFINPALVDQSNVLIAGHGRIEAAKRLGLKKVPCLMIEHLSEDEIRAYRLADNKLALNAGWDDDLLAIELSHLASPEVDIDITLTGFELFEVDAVIETVAPEEPNDPRDDELPGYETPLKSVRLGDIWALGPHRQICGDARDPRTVDQLMNGQLATMVITDPPYNEAIDGNVCGNGKIKHREFAMASGEMSKDEFTLFLTTVMQNHARVSKDGSIHFYFMDWRHSMEIQTAGAQVYDELKNVIVWSKDNGGMGTFYRSRYENANVFKLGTAPHINNFELGQHGRYRTNVWEYKGMNSRGKERDDLLKLHPTIKPVQMIADAIRDVSGRGDIVLDLFGGSGTTVIAAHKTGRRAYVAELDPHYCAITIARWEAYSGDEAVLISRKEETSETVKDEVA